MKRTSILWAVLIALFFGGCKKEEKQPDPFTIKYKIAVDGFDWDPLDVIKIIYNDADQNEGHEIDISALNKKEITVKAKPFTAKLQMVVRNTGSGDPVIYTLSILVDDEIVKTESFSISYILDHQTLSIDYTVK